MNYLCGFAIAFVALVVVTIPMYNGVQERARIALAERHVSEVVGAVSRYAEHTGSLPTTPADLGHPARNHRGEVAGPFLADVPCPPSGFTYACSKRSRTDFEFTARYDVGLTNVGNSQGVKQQWR